MSMKRTRQPSFRSRREAEEPAFRSAKATESPPRTWAEEMEDRADAVFVPYSMAARFDKGALIAHPTFGRGVVVGVDGRRIDVLFEAGKKTLGHAG